MDMERVISLYMDECASKQLREKTMQSYEKTLKLFTVWLKENEKTDRVEDIEDRTIRRYIPDLQTRGKYTVCTDKTTNDIKHPQRRRDYNKKVSNITINNYLRNLRAFFSWLVEIEYIRKSPKCLLLLKLSQIEKMKRTLSTFAIFLNGIFQMACIHTVRADQKQSRRRPYLCEQLELSVASMSWDAW